MIHDLMRLPISKPLFACASALWISACAGNSTSYPSFAIPTAGEDAGRVAMQFPGVVAPELREETTTQEALPAELDARLAAINNRASAASAAFSANLGATRTFARAASGASPDSDRWAEAQIRMADLTLHHNETALAVSDLDALAALADANRATADENLQIAELRLTFADALAVQAQQLETIAALLDP